MDNQSASKWAQLLTTLAVVVGLGLVIWELQQARTLARLQLSSDAFSEALSDYRSLLGENFGETFTRACVGSELNNSERVQVLAFLENRLNGALRSRAMDSVQRSAGVQWEQMAEWRVQEYLAVPLGRQRFEKNKDAWVPALREIAERHIANGVPPCSEAWLLDTS